VICAIHQPHYLPWGRYIQKILQADVFIVLDDADFTKNGWQNRTRIKTANGAQVLTVPAHHHLCQRICDVRIAYQRPWVMKHLRSVEQAYCRAPFFETCYSTLTAILGQQYPSLSELSLALLRWVLGVLEVERPLVLSSTLGVGGRGSERIADLVRRVGCDRYLSGAYAVDTYLDPARLTERGVRLQIQDWTAREYPQLHAGRGFIADLSVLDLLMNVGADAGTYLQ
jgi:hypothetical protein